MTGGDPTLALLLLSAVAAATLAVTSWSGRRRDDSREEFYAAGGLFAPVENGLALAGSHMSAASFLGIAGLVALFGYDGVLYSVGFLVAWPVVLLLTELVRNCGRFTLADVVTTRMRARPVRLATGLASLTVSVLYLVAQLVGAGSLVALLVAGESGTARTWTVVGIGVLMVVHVACGGMRATTWIQIGKALLLLSGSLALTAMVLFRFGGDLGALLSAAAERSGEGRDFLAPGLRHGGGWADGLDVISLGAALVLGTAGMPHIVSRFCTVPTARAARGSVVWATGLVGGFCLMTVVLGLGAAAVLGPAALRGADASGNTAVPLLAVALGGGAHTQGGTVLFALVAAVALATVLAVVAGVTLASSAAVAHDLYASLSRRAGKQRGGGHEVAVARLAAVGTGAVVVALGLAAHEMNVAFLVGLAFAVAASANLPVLLYALFWRRFTTRGAVWSVYGGLVPAVALMLLSPVVSGSPDALWPGADFALFPLENPALVSVPLGFLAGWAGTVTSRRPPDEAGYAETEVRSLTGAGAA